MPRPRIDLTSHFNQTVIRGHPADFPVTLRPVYQSFGGGYPEIPRRRAVVREDTGQVLAVVSARYSLVPHQRILELVEEAIRPLDCGPVPRGIYVDKAGARIRALFKFPALAQPVLARDELCPCLKIENTYDGSSRVAIHIASFRFVCTNLAVGGGGVFAGGFMAVHAGEVPIVQVTKELTRYLSAFDEIVQLYQRWAVTEAVAQALEPIYAELPKRVVEDLKEDVKEDRPPTVWEAYNRATHYATHRMRSSRSAFDLLARINRGFQQQFANLQVPISLN